jgi:endonuclease YncB( thermonuclease family)
LYLSLAGIASAAPLPECLPSSSEQAVIAGAGGGATLTTEDGRSIVLAGLAPPQTSVHEGQTGPGQILTGLVGETVRLVHAGPPDRYGRLKAHVILDDGRWLQEEVIGAGLALVRPDGGVTACIPALLAAEAAAAAAGTGFWRDSRNIVKAADDPSLLARNGIYGLVEGRIVSVGYGSRMVFLDFGRDIRTDFTVMVPNPLVPRLLEAGIAVEGLRGRDVRVRGVIEESGGPAIRIADPYALELLDRSE